MADTVRVGIIGSGKIAQDRHIPLLQKVPGVEVTQAWSRTPETARKAAQQFGIPKVVDRWERIVEAQEIDAVVIATPPNLHLPATLAALDSGKHVLCQARMARNLSEARRMLEASEATDLVTSLYAAGFGLKGDRVMRRLLQQSYLGDILEVRVTSPSERFGTSQLRYPQLRRSGGLFPLGHRPGPAALWPSAGY